MIARRRRNPDRQECRFPAGIERRVALAEQSRHHQNCTQTSGRAVGETPLPVCKLCGWRLNNLRQPAGKQHPIQPVTRKSSTFRVMRVKFSGIVQHGLIAFAPYSLQHLPHGGFLLNDKFSHGCNHRSVAVQLVPQPS